MASQITKYELWAIGAALGFSFLSARFLPFTVVIIILFSIVRIYNSGSLTIRTSVDWAITFLACLALASYWISPYPAISLPQILRLISGVGLFYAILNGCTSSAWLNRFPIAMGLVGLALAALGLVSTEWAMEKMAFLPSNLYMHLPVIFSDTINPNVLAGNLLLPLPIVGSYLLFQGRKSDQRALFFLGFSFTAMLGVLIITQSRGALLGLLFTLGALFTLRWRQGWIVAGAFILVLIISSIYVGGSQVVGFFTDLGGVTNSAGSRLEIWSRAIILIKDFPFTGVGMGSFGPVVDVFYPFFKSAPGTIAHAHNLFLQIGADLGLFGLAAWLLVLGMTIFSSWKIYKYGKINHSSNLASLGAGLIASQLGIIVHGMLDAVVWGMVRPAPLLWMVWGMAFAGVSIIESTHASEIRA